MATITFKDQTIPQQKGRDLLGQLLDAGTDVQYICMSGSCGTCKVKVLAGMEHLTARAGMETMHGCAPDERLACQAVCRGTGDIVVDQQ